MPTINNGLHKTLKLFHAFEDGALILLVITMVILGCSQIIVRNLGIGGLTWTEPAIRVNVLWLAMIGALHASRLQNHISINVLSHYMSTKVKRIMHFLVSLSCAGICVVVTWYSYLFVALEREAEVTAFLDIPAWICEAIIPFAFAIITIRFIFHSLHLPENHADDH